MQGEGQVGGVGGRSGWEEWVGESVGEVGGWEEWVGGRVWEEWVGESVGGVGG